MRIRSFPPIADRSAEVLVLGSMPGAASLAAKRYYAHPQNAFWRIMAELLKFDPDSSYSGKTKAMKAARIAVWDVLQSCTREGSLDSSIERDTQVPNDFQEFLRSHTNVVHVYFNGSIAESCFRRHVVGRMELDQLSFTRLPSTSPAHASKNYREKLKAWRAILPASAQASRRP